MSDVLHLTRVRSGRPDTTIKIESLGIRFLRFSNTEIYEDLCNVLAKIKRKTQELHDG